MSKFDTAVRAYAEWLLRSRWLVLALTGLLLAGSVYGASKLEFDTTFRIWHPADSPELAKYDARLSQYGSDETMLVVFRDERGLLNNEALSVIRRLTDDIWKIPSVKRVDSLANYAVTRGSRVEHESAALAATDKWIIAAGDQNDLLVWDRATGEQRQLQGHEGLIEHLLLSPDGGIAYSGSEDRSIRVWDLAQGKLIRVWRGLPEGVSALQLSKDGKRLVAGSYKRALAWDTETGKRLASLDGHEDYVTAVAISPDGKKAYVASKEIHVWDLDQGKKIATYPGHSGFINAIALSADGAALYSAGEDGVVASWDTTSGATQVLSKQADVSVLSLALDESRHMVVAGQSDGTVRGLAIDGRPATTARIHDDWVLTLAIAADGTVYSGSRDRNVGAHIPGQGPRSTILEAHRGAVRRVFLDPQGKLLTMSDDGDLYLWSPKDQQILARYYRSKAQPLAKVAKAQGTGMAKLRFVNAFRFPVELHVGGVSKGPVASAGTLELTDVAVPEAKTCENDAQCGEAGYCDIEGETPTCAGRVSLEAYVTGSPVRLWATETFMKPGDTKTLNAPSDDPFSVIVPAEASVDARSRVGALLAAFPKAEDQAALKPLLAELLGADAEDPQSFLESDLARQLADRLGSAPGVSPELVQFLTTHANAKVWPFKLPIQPFRLREVGDYLMRGPVPLAEGVVLNKARDTTSVIANLHVVETMSPLKQASDVRYALEKVVDAEQKRSGQTFHLAGDAIQDTTFERYAQRDIRNLFPLFLGMVIVVLAFWYRRPAGVLVPLSLVLLAVLNTMGFAGLISDGKLNNMTVAIPQVVLACCVGDLNHVFNGYLDRIRHGEGRHEAVVNTIVFEFVPCFWTAVTTALGFFSMIFGSSIVPIASFGWMGGIAAMAAWFGTFTVMPCILYLLPIPAKLQKEADEALKHKDDHKQEHVAAAGEAYAHIADDQPAGGFAHRMDLRLVDLARYVNRTAGAIIFMAFVIFCVASYGFTKVSFDTNSIEFFAKDAPFRVAADFAEAHIAGPTGLTLLVDTKEPAGIRKVEHLEALAKIHERLRADPEVTTVSGLADIMMGMNRVMSQDLAEDYRLPPTDAKASSFYNAYSFSLPAGLELSNRVSADESSTLIDVRLRNHPAAWVTDWGHELEKWSTIEVPGVRVSVTSKSWLYAFMLSSMSGVFFGDIAMAVLSISVTLFFLARNFRLGAIAMMVNLLPLYVTIGFTSLFGKTLDISVLLSCSVAMGIVVDDTIHYIAKYKRLRVDGMTHMECTELLAQEHSKASLATTLVLVGGFMMFMLTDYQLNQNFGTTTATMLTIGVMFDLFVLPAALAVWGPKTLTETRKTA